MTKTLLNYTQNRELSWLKFNKRVLQEAQDTSVPLLERMKFVSIFTSNLDEFFMIRVGSILDMMMLGDDTIDSRSGMSPAEQLDAVYAAVAPLYKEREKTYQAIKKELRPYGVCGVSFKDLDNYEKKYVKKYFKEQVLPVLSPQIVDASHPFPHLQNKEIYVIAKLKSSDKTSRMGIVPVPQYISDILYLPGQDMRYIRMEKVIMEYLDLIFAGYQISDENYICVTRNADVSPEDEAYDGNEDFRYRMQKTLKKRRIMAVVRLEVFQPLGKEMEQYLCQKLMIRSQQIFRTKVPMKLEYIFSIIDKLPEAKRANLLDKPFVPQRGKMVEEGKITKQIRKRDILLSYPYESMEPFLQLVREASTDPSVMTIKITIYRLAKKARLVEYLCAAAENGKEVTVLIELRARFDEQNNIDWSERLEEAGCHVIYGFEGYKVHSKVCQITYRSHSGVQYITQIGTGNYNEKTAAMYTDVCLMTADQTIGEDATEFFKNMAIGNLDGHYKALSVAPTGLKKMILNKIDGEIAKGVKGRIIMKMNSVTDIDFIRKISEASQAGVQIDLIVRGICCILPEVPGYTENVRVTSVVGRFLEHTRIFSFGQGQEQSLYIGSADMMTRNTEKRVEVACPIYDETVKEYLNHILDVVLKDNVKARRLTAEGKYVRKDMEEQSICAQTIFMQEAMQTGEHSKPGFWQHVFRKKRK